MHIFCPVWGAEERRVAHAGITVPPRKDQNIYMITPSYENEIMHPVNKIHFFFLTSNFHQTTSKVETHVKVEIELIKTHLHITVTTFEAH